ncbi:MAG: ABC transporter substrate-binding protein [Burkholderiaceae bacterium]
MKALLAVLLLSLSLSSQVLALEVTDQRGKLVTLAKPPQRIVSLLPSLTESVCALGACQRLVGVDRYSNFPASVRRLPQVGGGLDPNIEAIAALRPDLVLLSGSTRAAEQLQALGIAVLALEPQTSADVPRVLAALGTVLGVPDAQRVWREIQAGLAEAERSVPPGIKGVRVYFEVSDDPYAAGTASFMGETLARLGAHNIIGPELGPFPKINPEWVVRARPDVIMISQRSVHGLQRRPGWAALPAVRENRVCVFTPAQSDVLVRPGPRMAEAARIMAQCLRDKAPPQPAASPGGKLP